MLRLILALAAVLVVGASLASRLAEVHAAGNKPPIKGSTTTTTKQSATRGYTAPILRKSKLITRQQR